MYFARLQIIIQSINEYLPSILYMLGTKASTQNIRGGLAISYSLFTFPVLFKFSYYFPYYLARKIYLKHHVKNGKSYKF